MDKIIGIIILIICSVYGLRQAYLGKPAFKSDYWLMVIGIILSVFLINN